MAQDEGHQVHRPFSLPSVNGRSGEETATSPPARVSGEAIRDSVGSPGPQIFEQRGRREWQLLKGIEPQTPAVEGTAPFPRGSRRAQFPSMHYAIFEAHTRVLWRPSFRTHGDRTMRVIWKRYGRAQYLCRPVHDPSARRTLCAIVVQALQSAKCSITGKGMWMRPTSRFAVGGCISAAPSTRW